MICTLLKRHLLCNFEHDPYEFYQMGKETFQDSKIIFLLRSFLTENVFSCSQNFCHLTSIDLKLYLSTKIISLEIYLGMSNLYFLFGFLHHFFLYKVLQILISLFSFLEQYFRYFQILYNSYYFHNSW